MPAIPLFLGGLPVIACAMLDPRHRPVGDGAAFVRGERFVPAALAICHDTRDGGYYLVGCSAEWEAVTDTWHQTLEDAMDQAETEYPGIGERWMRT